MFIQETALSQLLTHGGISLQEPVGLVPVFH